MFNQCANEDLTLATLALWGGVHPMLKTLPTDWKCSVLHSPEPAEHVREFLEAIKEVLDEQLLEGK